VTLEALFVFEYIETVEHDLIDKALIHKSIIIKYE